MTTNVEWACEPHPAVDEARQTLLRAVRAGIPARRYELATLAAALAMRSSYCSLAHGRLMVEQLGLPLADIVRDPRDAGCPTRTSP